MSVNTPSKMYQENINRWFVVRSCIDGQETIKAGGEKFLPKLTGQSAEDYLAYQNRAVFFDATNRSADALHGVIFSKDPVQPSISEQFKLHLDDVDNSGTELDEFVSDIAWDAIQTAWGGILVDHAPVPEGASQAEAQSYGGAFLKWYEAESIINWRHSVINGAKVLTLVVLREDIEEEKPDDMFTTKITEAYRVLALDADGFYYQRVYVKDETAKDGFSPREEIYPEVQGRKFDYIPFFTCPGEKPEKSMLLGLAYENIGHYQKTAELENALFLTSFATPCAVNMEQPPIKDKKTGEVTGFQEITLSPSIFKFFAQRDDDGKFSNVDVKFLEFTGAGIDRIIMALNNCLDRMAKLGVQAIGAEKKGVETAEVAKIHRASENGVLGAFARSMSNKVTQAVRLMAKWNLIPDEEADSWSYQLNSDFNVEQISDQIIAIMHTARQSNEIPRGVWKEALIKKGLLAEGTTDEQFAEMITSDDNALSHGVSGD